MSPHRERIAYLLEVYTSQKATAQEEQELMEWVQEAQEDSELKSYMVSLWNHHKSGADFSHVNWDRMFDQVIERDKVFAIAPTSTPRSIRWSRIAAAAAILLLFASGAFFFLINNDTNQPAAKLEKHQPRNDVAPPAINKATLTLADGKVIILDSAGYGPLSIQGAANASKVNDGKLVYAGDKRNAVEYHTLNVPKGSKPMQLQLADGSEVWLNAASSITFPNLFTGDERKVTITGEAYFEVAKHEGRKFMVTANGVVTEVLGTHFNINAYENEKMVKVTLLEGLVNVSKGSLSAQLKPGQQARLTDKEVNALSNVNTEQVMAWKNGLFEFDETDIQTIMRQIERWYDVKILFDGNVTQNFNGTISRQVNASKVLSMLEKTGGVRFFIEGNNVIVKKY